MIRRSIAAAGTSTMMPSSGRRQAIPAVCELTESLVEIGARAIELAGKGNHRQHNFHGAMRGGPA